MADMRDPRDGDGMSPYAAMFLGIAAAKKLAKSGEKRPLHAMKTAEKMRKAGATERAIYRETNKGLEGSPYAGVSYDAAKNPRFEVSDDKATLSRFGLDASRRGRVGDVIKHPELDRATGMSALPVRPVDRDIHGGYGEGTVYLGNKQFMRPTAGRSTLSQDTRGVMLHEMQHVAQDAEGRPFGGRGEDFKGSPATRDAKYKRIAGEVEAEITRQSSDMTAAERRASHPDDRAKAFGLAPRSKQIIMDAQGRIQEMSGKTKLPMDDASRMARANGMGFDTKRVWYHGTNAPDLDVIETGRRDPGAWFTTDVNNANNYVGMDGGLHDVYLKSGRQFVVDADIDDAGRFIPVHDGNRLDFDNNVDIVRHAQRQGYDSVRFPDGNFTESGDTMVVFNSNQVRSVNAAFDPDKASSPRLAEMAGDIKDFGEKIGGARKDRAVKTGPKVKTAMQQAEVRQSGKRFEIFQDGKPVLDSKGKPKWFGSKDKADAFVAKSVTSVISETASRDAKTQKTVADQGRPVTSVTQETASRDTKPRSVGDNAPPDLDRLTRAAEKLEAVAQRTMQKAEAEANRPRLMNTARRARMGGGAIEQAQQEIADAKTALKIAEALRRGEAGELSNISSLSDVRRLRSEYTQAMYAADRAKNIPYGQARSGMRGGQPTSADIDYVKADPYVRANLPSQSDFPMLREALKGQGVSSELKRLESLTGQGQHIHRDAKDIAAVEKVAKAIKAIKDKPGDWAKHKWQVSRIQYEANSWLSSVREYRAEQRLGVADTGGLKKILGAFADVVERKSAPDPVKLAERDLIGRKIPGFFPTPEALAERMAKLADVREGQTVLEPSAGTGRLADAAKRLGAKVDTVEMASSLRDILQKKGHNLVADDFTTMDLKPGSYDRILMNPPFEKGQDMAHVQRAYEALKPGGKMVAVMGEGAFFRSDKQATEFRGWLEGKGSSEKLPEGTFKEPNTGVNTRLVVIEKPADVAAKAMAAAVEGRPVDILESVKAATPKAETNYVLSKADEQIADARSRGMSDAEMRSNVSKHEASLRADLAESLRHPDSEWHKQQGIRARNDLAMVDEIKGKMGWSDAARTRSAEVRAADAAPADPSPAIKAAKAGDVKGLAAALNTNTTRASDVMKRYRTGKLSDDVLSKMAPKSAAPAIANPLDRAMATSTARAEMPAETVKPSTVSVKPVAPPAAQPKLIPPPAAKPKSPPQVAALSGLIGFQNEKTLNKALAAQGKADAGEAKVEAPAKAAKAKNAAAPKEPKAPKAPKGPTVAALRAQAKEAGIKGAGRMTKAALQEAVGKPPRMAEMTGTPQSTALVPVKTQLPAVVATPLKPVAAPSVQQQAASGMAKSAALRTLAVASSITVGAGTLGLIAADKARTEALASGADRKKANDAALAAGATTAAVSAGIMAAVGKGIQVGAKALAVAAPKVAPFLGPAGLAVAGAGLVYGAYEGYQKSGTLAGAAVGALSGGDVFEGQKNEATRMADKAKAFEDANAGHQSVAMAGGMTREAAQQFEERSQTYSAMQQVSQNTGPIEVDEFTRTRRTASGKTVTETVKPYTRKRAGE